MTRYYTEIFEMRVWRDIFTYTETVVPFCIFLDFHSIVHFINIWSVQETVQTAVQAIDFIKSIPDRISSSVAHLNIKFSVRTLRVLRNRIYPEFLPFSMNPQYFWICKRYSKLFVNSKVDGHHGYIALFEYYELHQSDNNLSSWKYSVLLG